jgi:photosystem II stability/assembly factor-like uncharacterized protein
MMNLLLRKAISRIGTTRVGPARQAGLAVALHAFFLVALPRGAEGTWEWTNGPYGAASAELPARLPVLAGESGTIFLRAKGASTHGVYYWNGGQWVEVGGGVRETYIWDWTPGGGGGVLALCEGGSLYRIGPDLEWHAVQEHLPDFAPLYGFSESRTGAILIPTYGPIFRSVDTATSWRQIATRGFVPRPKAVAQGFDSTVLVVAPPLDTMVNSSDAYAVFRSPDNGRSWNPVLGDGTPSVDPVQIRFLSDGTIYILDGFGHIACSSDSGYTWRQVGAKGRAMAACVDPSGTIYLVNDYGVHQSTDRGMFYATIGPEPPVARTALTDGASLVYGDSTLMLKTSEGLHYYHLRDGRWASALDGLRLVSVTSLLSAFDQVLFAGTATEGIFRTDDRGRSWRTVLSCGDEGCGEVRTMLLSGEGHIYAVVGNTIYRSVDGGWMWTRIRPNVWFGDVYDLEIDPDGHVLAATAFGLFRRAGLGMWQRLELGDASFAVHGVLNGPDGQIFASGRSRWAAEQTPQQLYRSTDNGASWTHLSLELHESDFSAMTLSAAGTLMLAGSEGILRSEDNGDTWHWVKQTRCRELVSGGDSMLVALTDACAGSGHECPAVLYSRDDGHSWQPLGAAPSARQRFQSVHRSRDGTVYLGTSGGVLRFVARGEEPEIQIVAPQQGTSLPMGRALDITVAATAAASEVRRVDFFAGQHFLGSDSSAPYDISWAQPPAGRHSLLAKAIARNGGTASAAPVVVSVGTASVLNGVENERGIHLLAGRNGIPGIRVDAGRECAVAVFTLQGRRRVSRRLRGPALQPLDALVSAPGVYMVRVESDAWSPRTFRIKIAR